MFLTTRGPMYQYLHLHADRCINIEHIDHYITHYMLVHHRTISVGYVGREASSAVVSWMGKG